MPLDGVASQEKAGYTERSAPDPCRAEQKTPRSVSRRCTPRFIVPQSDETAGILKQLKGETSADSAALEKKGLDRKTNHEGLMKVERQPRSARPPPWSAMIEHGRKSKRRCDRSESMAWFAPSYMKYKAQSKKG